MFSSYLTCRFLFVTLGSGIFGFFIGTQETNHEPGVLRFVLDYFPSFPEHRMMCSSIMQLKCSYFCIMYFEITLWVAAATQWPRQEESFSLPQATYWFPFPFFFLFFMSLPKLYNCSCYPNTKHNWFSFISTISTLLLSLSPSLLFPFFFTHLSVGAPPQPSFSLTVRSYINKVKPNWFLIETQMS